MWRTSATLVEVTGVVSVSWFCVYCTNRYCIISLHGLLYLAKKRNNILGIENNSFITHGRSAVDYAGTSSVPLRSIQTIKSITTSAVTDLLRAHRWKVQFFYQQDAFLRFLLHHHRKCQPTETDLILTSASFIVDLVLVPTQSDHPPLYVGWCRDRNLLKFTKQRHLKMACDQSWSQSNIHRAVCGISSVQTLLRLPPCRAENNLCL